MTPTDGLVSGYCTPVFGICPDIFNSRPSLSGQPPFTSGYPNVLIHPSQVTSGNPNAQTLMSPDFWHRFRFGLASLAVGITSVLPGTPTVAPRPEVLPMIHRASENRVHDHSEEWDNPCGSDLRPDPIVARASGAFFITMPGYTSGVS